MKSTTIYVGQKLTIPSGKASQDRGSADRNQTVSVTYQNYTIKPGDSIWSIAYAHSIPQNELLKANSFNANTVLYVGQVIRSVYHVPVKPTPGPQYGELLDWWTEAQYVLKYNVLFTVTDFYTGTSFKGRSYLRRKSC